MAFLEEYELQQAGFASIGKDVRVSRLASIYAPERITIGDHSRVDDFVVLSAGEGGISIGRNVHVAVNASVIGAGRVDIADFAGISGRVAIYSSNDDYSGRALTGPTVPDRYRGVQAAGVRIGEHCIIGAGSIILPGVELGIGAAIGALSLVKSSCEPFGVYAGSPARRVGTRSRALLSLAEEYLASDQSEGV